MNPSAKSSGVANSGRPVISVDAQAKIWIPLGITITRLAAEK